MQAVLDAGADPEAVSAAQPSAASRAHPSEAQQAVQQLLERYQAQEEQDMAQLAVAQEQRNLASRRSPEARRQHEESIQQQYRKLRIALEQARLVEAAARGKDYQVRGFLLLRSGPLRVYE